MRDFSNTLKVLLTAILHVLMPRLFCRLSQPIIGRVISMHQIEIYLSYKNNIVGLLKKVGAVGTLKKVGAYGATAPQHNPASNKS